MPKVKFEYRGQDATRELIKERAEKLSALHDMKTAVPSNAKFWKQACDELHAEMIAEGLNNTAAEILKLNH